MLSRAADAIYWIGRYIERAESVARFIDVNLNLALDLPPGTTEQWKPLVGTTGDLYRFLERYDTTTRDTVIEFLAFDKANPNSIYSCVRAARENARAVRDVISSDMWEHLNATYLQVSDESARLRARHSSYQFFSEVKLAGRTFEGLTDDTMSHGESWNFCRLGRMLERSDKIARILDLKHFLSNGKTSGGALDDIEWSAVLQSASGLELYRKRHGRLMKERIVEFLLLDREFPRSVHFCLVAAEEALHDITGTAIGTFRIPAEQRLGQLRSELAFASAEEILQHGLHETIDALQLKLNLAGDSITHTFFVSAPVYSGWNERMTFCLGIRVRDGLVGLADTRITSGNEVIVARKVSTFHHEKRAVFVMTSGLRSVRDKVVTYFDDLWSKPDPSLDRLFKVVNLFASQVRKVAEEDRQALERSGLQFNIHALIGGQMENDPEHKLYLVYPQGNWVEVGEGTAYSIIGASGYGKPVLDRTLKPHDSMRFALKVGFLAFDSSRISAADVDFPIDVVLCSKGSYKLIEHRFEKADLQEISTWWQERLRHSVNELPRHWMERVFSKLGPEGELIGTDTAMRPAVPARPQAAAEQQESQQQQ